MKKVISKIWGISLVVTLIATLLLAVAPASAGTLSLSAETIVSTTSNVIGPAGVDVKDIAVAADGKTIYVAAKSTASNKLLYKSTDAGLTWTDITGTIGITETDRIAVQPDDANTVVVLDITTAGGAAYVSANGGSTYSSLSLPAGTYYDVVISTASAGVRNIGVVGSTAGPVAALKYFNLGASLPAWADAYQDAAWTGEPATMEEVRAVAFSPNFASDKTAVAVLEDTGVAAGAKFSILSFASKKWDTTGGFASYPVDLVTGVVTSVNVAEIVLAPDYLGADEATRIAFVGCSITVAGVEAGGIFRMSDSAAKSLKTAAVRSIGFNGSALIAGDNGNNNVLRSADPLASSPTVSSARSYKKPGIAANTATVVAWAGTSVVAGNSGNESAFATSSDNGLTFNDVSLIDTALTNLIDAQVSADGATVYLLSTDGADTSLWRKDASGWRRIFTTADVNGYIIRAAASDFNVLYIADTAATTMYYTTDGGLARWYIRAAANSIQDLAVESSQVAYIAVDTALTVSKTTNAGFTWGTAVSTGLAGGTEANVIVSLSTGNVIVASDTGYVAYSTDSNTTWTKITPQIQTGALLTQVTATGLATNDYIYAASTLGGTYVVRWQVGVSTSWTSLTYTTTLTVATPMAYGIGVNAGTLYVILSDGTDSELARTLNPTALSPTWNYVKKTGVTLITGPQNLRISTGVKLWAIDLTGTDELYSYTDTMVATVVTLKTPVTNTQVTVNPVTGRATDVAFSWAKPGTSVTGYRLQIYTDAAGTAIIASVNIASTEDPVVVLLGPYQSALTGQFVEFSPGMTYYWRVRVQSFTSGGVDYGPIIGQWSEMRSLTVQPGVAMVPKLLSPANGGTGVSKTPSFSWEPIAGTTQYKFQLSADVGLTSPIVDVSVSGTAYAVTTALTEGTTYYWSVKSLAPVEGGWSTVANFTVAPKPVVVVPTTAPPPITITQVPAPTFTMPPAPAPTTITISPPAPAAQIAPGYIWAIIIIGAVLVIAVIVLIVRTRRTA